MAKRNKLIDKMEVTVSSGGPKAGAVAFVVQNAAKAVIYVDPNHLAFLPGLNILAGVDASSSHPVIKAGVADETLVFTDAGLTGYGPAELLELAAITEQPAALGHMLELALAKPVTAGRRERRDPNLVRLLQRRLKARAPAKAATPAKKAG